MNRSAEAKRRVARAAEAAAAGWKTVALELHARPEIGLKEHASSARLAIALAEADFTVQTRVAGLDTAFVATAPGSAKGPRIAFLAEYDALPGLGHACSHNLIATAACLAAVALARTPGRARGKIQVIGCPAEESYGGKARLLEAGCFRGIDAALMAHGYDLNLSFRPMVGRSSLIFEFFGRPAHASSSPERGINALDAVLQTFTSVALLRQQVRAEARIHGIITHGGTAANIIPDYTRAEFYVRSASPRYLQELRKRVASCAAAASRATGTRLKVSSEGYDFLPLRANDALAEGYERNLRFLRQPIDRLPGEAGYGSSDFGNVSRAIPALHAYFRIAKNGIKPHTRAFAEASKSPAGLAGMVNAAKALALTGWDLLHEPALLRTAQREFDLRRRSEQAEERRG